MKTKLLLLISHLRLHWKKITKSFLVPIIVVGSIATTYFFYTKYRETAALLTNAQQQLSAESESSKNVVLDKIKAIVELPDEEPSIATVTDMERIKDQPFFAKAKNDDMVVIFYKEGKALLYRPSENKIINWAFLDTGQTATKADLPVGKAGGQVAGVASNAALPTTSGPSPQPASVTVALYNGTTRAGLTVVADGRLTATLPEVKIITKDNAAKNSYKKTVVVDVTGDNRALAEKIVSEIGGEIKSLPNGESTPSAQIAVILGEDFKE